MKEERKEERTVIYVVDGFVYDSWETAKDAIEASRDR